MSILLHFGGNCECGEDSALALRGQALKRKVSMLEMLSASLNSSATVSSEKGRRFWERRPATNIVWRVRLALREVRIGPHFEHLLGVAFAVRSGEQDKLVSVEFA